MKMGKNGRSFAGKKSRHIHIRYFFIKVVWVQENIELQYIFTEKIIDDFFTKPLQSAPFKKVRDIVMGLVSFPIEVRVGNNGESRIIDNDK